MRNKTLSMILVLSVVLQAFAFMSVSAATVEYAQATPLKTWDMSTLTSSGGNNFTGTGFEITNDTTTANVSNDVYSVTTGTRMEISIKNGSESLIPASDTGVWTIELPVKIAATGTSDILGTTYNTFHMIMGNTTPAMFRLHKNGKVIKNVTTDIASNTIESVTYTDKKFEYKFYMVVDNSGAQQTVSLYRENAAPVSGDLGYPQTLITNDTKTSVDGIKMVIAADSTFNMEIGDVKLYEGNIMETSELTITASAAKAFVPAPGKTDTITFTSNAATPAWSLAEDYTGVSITSAGVLTVSPDAAAGTVKVKVTAGTDSRVALFPIAARTMTPIKTWDMSSFAGVSGVSETYANSRSRVAYTNTENLTIEACLGANISFTDDKLVYTADKVNENGIGITTNTKALFATTDGARYTLAIPLKFTRGNDAVKEDDPNNWLSHTYFQTQLCDAYWGTGGNKVVFNSLDMDSNGLCKNGDYCKLTEDEKQQTLYIVYECGAGNSVKTTAYLDGVKFDEATKATDANSSGNLTRLYIRIDKAQSDYTLEINDIMLYEGVVTNETDVQDIQVTTTPASGENVTCDVTIKSGGWRPINAMLLGAAKTGGVLTSAAVDTKTASGITGTTYTVTVPKAEGQTVEFMLWDEKLTPIKGFDKITLP